MLPTIFWHSQYKEGREKYEGGKDLKSITNFVLENTGHDHLVTKQTELIYVDNVL